ncbi:acyl-CoA dehydrogenase family protein [uncultured Roseibium sp.]|uniref:acyl-CoA dehydrogenase family protein n=1 Tax=uncultured Roseibium sp. TaxID=1936171 RepID=UPI0032179B91
MNFELSSDLQMLADTLRRFFADHLDIEIRNETAYELPYHAPNIWTKLSELGILGAFLTEKQGGFGGTAQDISTVFEEVGLALCPEPLLGNLMGLRLLAASGRVDLVERTLSGETRVALALVEPEMSTDLDRLSARAELRNGSWQLTGTKTAIYGGPSAECVLIAANTDEGLGLFMCSKPEMVESSMVDGEGISELQMENLSAECLGTDMGEVIADVLDLGCIALCAEAVGAMERLIAMTVDYLGQRQQFGHKLSQFQALQHRVVDMVSALEQARSITIRAVASYGTPDQARHVAMAKNLIGRAAIQVSEEAIQLHGGIGMTWEYAGSHYAKRLVMIDHQLGDRFDHASRLVTL